jgi:hypothetical protein
MITLNSNYELFKYPTYNNSVVDELILKTFIDYGVQKTDTLYDVNQKVDLVKMLESFSKVIEFKDSLEIIKGKVYYVPFGLLDFAYILVDGFVFNPFSFLLQLDKTELYEEEIIDVEKTTTDLRQNPIDKDRYLPTIVWLTVRSIFLDKNKLGRNYKKGISEIYDIVYFDISREEAISRAFAIAVSSLQKNKFLKKGTIDLTKKGEKRSKELSRINENSLEKKYKEYEEILRQGKL